MNGRGVAITDWAAVSPFGIGRDAFANGIREAKGTAAALDPERWPTAEDRACLVPGFEVREVLGNAGTRTMDRFTGLAVAAIGDLLRRWAGDPDTGDRAETGLVLGTTMGSAQSTMDFVRPSFTAIAPFFVDPAQMPNAVMNCAAARSAIWHRLTGPNATVAGGHSAGLHALGYARRLMRYGHAAHVVCGAVEEYSAARSWLEHHTRDGARAAAAPGEGCAVLMLEEPGAEAPLADVLDVVSEACLDEDFGRAVRTCLRELLDRSGARAEEVWAASVSDAPGPAGEQERDAVRELFGDGPVERVPVAGLIGDTAAASGAFQIAAVLAVAEEDTGAAGRLAAISSVDGDGTVSAALLRLRGRAC
ncbi:beta-ketoacyl synthase N-terminal-like domain-containing protein [Amycolatopsis sp. CA-230715]|uniref:beta-ketoacyl synthase N-terminal-like domain-containing protein n=1 Tax=Amycolatopsis sp. CA-230715 TaxID=2745196 RepID=UPI001C02E0F6|nr:beta-ketoacyl synthase N-terminal-like domain-containing protein [Amycolatopsis sp. CA-230715]QWF84496.1 hypothetical protein HUW46_07946 [Amycolatopsis sp. CA-230715]